MIVASVATRSSRKLWEGCISLFWQLGMDMIGPLPETPRGNKYVVTLTDYFSKLAEAAPLPSKHAEGVATFIYSERGFMS